MKQQLILFLLAGITFAGMFSSCRGKQHRIQYVAVPVDTAAHNDIEAPAEEWRDEPLLDIPDSPEEATTNGGSTEEMDQFLRGGN